MLLKVRLDVDVDAFLCLIVKIFTQNMFFFCFEKNFSDVLYYRKKLLAKRPKLEEKLYFY